MRDQWLNSIATTISDYRQGEIPAPTPQHVDRWIRQFAPSLQEAMLAELDYVLKQSYLSRENFLTVLRCLARRTQLIDPSGIWQTVSSAMLRVLRAVTGMKSPNTTWPTYWHEVQFLEIQKHGDSQKEMVRLFKQLLAQEFGLPRLEERPKSGPFLYLDDILFTGNRILADLRRWIQETAPARANIVVVLIAAYRRGFARTHDALIAAARKARKAIRLHWLRFMEFEDRDWISTERDGFHATSVPDTPLASAYLKELADAGFSPRLRIPSTGHQDKLFSSEAGRQLLEQQFLLAGLKIRSFCRNPQEILRPLGYDGVKDLGFGATLITHRNCPNNCPVALWWGDPDAPSSHPLSRWYPLFPRKV